LFDDSNKEGCFPCLVLVFLSSEPIFIQKHKKAKNPEGCSKETFVLPSSIMIDALHFLKETQI